MSCHSGEINENRAQPSAGTASTVVAGTNDKAPLVAGGVSQLLPPERQPFNRNQSTEMAMPLLPPPPPNQMPVAPSNVPVPQMHRDDGSSGYGSPDSDTFEAQPQVQ